MGAAADEGLLRLGHARLGDLLRKLVNAGKLCGTELLIMGGDLAGQELVPVAGQAGSWTARFRGTEFTLAEVAEVAEFERRVATMGARHAADLREVIGAKPDLLLDNGGDLFLGYLGDPYPGLLGGAEETTSGRMRLRPLAGRLDVPVLVINDSPIKQFAENRHAVGLSVLESYLRITNRMTNGRRAVVFGYGACGKGIAAAFRSAHAVVAVIETDPVARLEACLDGFGVPAREEALREADIVVTATGAESVVSGADLAVLRDDVVLCNAGHFPVEIAVDELAASPLVLRAEGAADGISTWHLADGRRVHLLAGGHMVNLAGPRPLGNSIESMDLGFALQARCLEAIATGSVGAGQVVVAVPRFIDERVARAFLDAYGTAGTRPADV